MSCSYKKCTFPCLPNEDVCHTHKRMRDRKKPAGLKRNINKPNRKKKSTRNKTKTKKRTLADLRKELWHWTSLLVRLSWADDQGYCTCIVRKTRHYYWKDGIQAGHFVRKSKSGITEFSLDNIFPQSAASNFAEEQYEMGVSINLLYEKNKVNHSADELIKMSNIPFVKKRDYYDTTIVEYKEKVFKLTIEKNLNEWFENCPKKYLNSYGVTFKNN